MTTQPTLPSQPPHRGAAPAGSRSTSAGALPARAALAAAGTVALGAALASGAARAIWPARPAVAIAQAPAAPDQFIASDAALPAHEPAHAPAAHLAGVPLSAAAIGRLMGMSPVPPVPPDPTNAVADDPAAAHFGRFLFFDRRLSGDYVDPLARRGRARGVSCAQCHRPDDMFDDALTVAVGLGVGRRHTPTLLNAAHHRWFNWDGRRDSLWAQAIEAMERPHEMGSNRMAIAHLVLRDPELGRAYSAVFGPVPELSADAPRNARPQHEDDPADADHPHVRAWATVSDEDRHAANRIISNLAKAIAAYQRLLVSGDSRFDRFVHGLKTGDAESLAALSARELRGAELFANTAGCWQCHHGPLLSDFEFHNVLAPVAGGAGALPDDPGRFAGTRMLLADPFNAAASYADAADSPAKQRLATLEHSPSFWGAFKTPSLRNVARTGPYFHNGQMPDLLSVVQHYNTFEHAPRAGHGHRDPLLQPLGLPDEDLAALVAFLGTLNGRPVPAELCEPPDSPVPSGEGTTGR
jgi:cytochrome c peroxidase